MEGVSRPSSQELEGSWVLAVGRTRLLGVNAKRETGPRKLHLWFAERLTEMEEESSEGEWISSGFSVRTTMCGSGDRPSFTSGTQEPKIASIVPI